MLPETLILWLQETVRNRIDIKSPLTDGRFDKLSDPEDEVIFINYQKFE